MTDLITLPRATGQQAIGACTHAMTGWHSLAPLAVIAAAMESLDALRKALEQPTECRWLQDGDEDSGAYMASCNRRYFVLEDGTPTDNHMTHCCYCGKPLVEVPIEPEDNHD